MVSRGGSACSALCSWAACARITRAWHERLGPVSDVTSESQKYQEHPLGQRPSYIHTILSEVRYAESLNERCLVATVKCCRDDHARHPAWLQKKSQLKIIGRGLRNVCKRLPWIHIVKRDVASGETRVIYGKAQGVRLYM